MAAGTPPPCPTRATEAHPTEFETSLPGTINSHLDRSATCPSLDSQNCPGRCLKHFMSPSSDVVGGDTDPVAIQGYHCLCSTLILVSLYSLASLPTRAPPANDQAYILSVSSFEPADGARTLPRLTEKITQARLLNVRYDRNLTTIRREDGFERRTCIRCKRCGLTVAYQLDQSQFTQKGVQADQVIYVLPGGLVPTAEMTAGERPQQAPWMPENV